MTSALSMRTMRELDSGYSSEVDTVDEETWYRLLVEFSDASIYQTWAYGLVRSGRQNIGHVLVKMQGRVVAMAQCRIQKTPAISAGIAYVLWGPLWQRRGTCPDADVFRQAIRALRNEYTCRRGLLLRLYPVLFDDEAPCFRSILEDEGFARREEENRSRTLLMDLNPPLDELHNRLRPHWQRELKVAVKQKLDIVEGGEDELFEQFIGIYKEMVARKKFREPNDVHDFRAMQKNLPHDLRMKVMLCRTAEGICAGVITSAIGGTALYLFGATSTVGMKSRGSYLLQWKLIEWLKGRLVSWYDLNGIDPDANPGTYKFKSDLAGDKGKDVRFLGRFESCESLVSLACVNVGERLKEISQALLKT